MANSFLKLHKTEQIDGSLYSFVSYCSSSTHYSYIQVNVFPYGSSEGGTGHGHLGHQFLQGMMLLLWKDNDWVPIAESCLNTALRTFFKTVFQINMQHGWKHSWSFNSVSENSGTGCRNMGQIYKVSLRVSVLPQRLLICIMPDIIQNSHTKFLSPIALSPRLCLKCESCTCRMRTQRILVSWDWGCVPQLHPSSLPVLCISGISFLWQMLVRLMTRASSGSDTYSFSPNL